MRPKNLYDESIHSTLPYTTKLNKSYHFLLPLTDIPTGIYNSIYNTYLFYNGIGVPNSIYIKLSELVENFDCGEQIDNSLYLVELDPIYSTDYDKFLLGKYSEFSPNAKDSICTKLAKGSTVEDSDLFQILYKTNERKKYLEDLIGMKLSNTAELCSIFNKEGENYVGE